MLPPFADPLADFLRNIDGDAARETHLALVERRSAVVLGLLADGPDTLQRLRAKFADQLWPAVAEIAFAGRAVEAGFDVVMEPRGAEGPDLMLTTGATEFFVEVAADMSGDRNVVRHFSVGRELRHIWGDLPTGLIVRVGPFLGNRRELSRHVAALRGHVERFRAGRGPDRVRVRLLADGHWRFDADEAADAVLLEVWLRRLEKDQPGRMVERGEAEEFVPGAEVQRVITRKLKKKSQLNLDAPTVVAVEMWLSSDDIKDLVDVLYLARVGADDGRPRSPLFATTRRLSAVWASTRIAPDFVGEARFLMPSSNPDVAHSLPVDVLARLGEVVARPDGSTERASE